MLKNRIWRRLIQCLWFLLISGFVWFAIVVILMSIIHYTGTQDNRQPADAIVVLGSGLVGNGRPGPALTRRSLHVAQVYAEGYAPFIICTGGQSPYQPRSEAAGCRELLLAQGVPDGAILLEENSRSTEENALFSRRIMDENNIRSVIIVSDSYHVFRARYLFARDGLRVYLSPVPANQTVSWRNYGYNVLREIAALHWQVFKETFNVPVTYIDLRL
ncbi:MAG: YdcF family protein [Chloroflexota bacterium]